MYFDFEDYRPDITPVGRVISWREGILLSVIGHMAVIILVLLSPKILPTAQPRQPLDLIPAEKPPEDTRFVFMDPTVDLEALRAPARAPASDKNRQARSPEAVPVPKNPDPVSRGNTPERVERSEPPEVARGRGAGPEPAVEQPPPPTPTPPGPEPRPDSLRLPETQNARANPPSAPATSAPRSITGGGALGDALRNLDKYVKQQQQYDNANGGAAQFGPIQFDSKGVEFGPWIRRFIAQVKRNWEPLIPNGPIMMRQTGHVVVTLNIYKNGDIKDVTVAQPSLIDGFNNAAYGALTASNPTQPLPPEYPADKAFFTITFFYNERPPEQ
jgi:TonB family protein